MTKHNEPRVKLTRQQMHALGKAMDPVITVDPDGFAVYEATWSDERLADDLLIPKRHVASYRNAVFGRLRKAAPESRPATAKLIARVEQLEAADTARIAMLAEFERRLNAMTIDIVGLTKRLEIREKFTLPGPSDSTAIRGR